MTGHASCNEVVAGQTMSATQTSPREDGDVELRALVHRHRIIWESRPELAVVKGALAPIGFVVTLTAVHDHPAHPPSPGCPECTPVRAALERIAHAVLPRGEHASQYEVHVANALESDPSHGRRTEISATITILHRGIIDQPPDDCERECLSELRARLKALGAQEGHWYERGG